MPDIIYRKSDMVRFIDYLIFHLDCLYRRMDTFKHKSRGVIFPKNRNEYKYSFKFGKDETKQIYRGSDREDIV